MDILAKLKVFTSLHLMKSIPRLQLQALRDKSVPASPSCHGSLIDSPPNTDLFASPITTLSILFAWSLPRAIQLKTYIERERARKSYASATGPGVNACGPHEGF